MSRVIIGALLLVLACAQVALADEVAANVGLLRSADPAVPAELADAVDAALLRDLAGLAGIESPVISPVDFAEVQLGVGCTDESRSCYESIAGALHVSALIVRALSTADDGSVRLELRYFAAASRDELAAVSSEVPLHASSALVDAVPGLVRELFGIPEVVPPAEPLPPAQDTRARAPAPRQGEQPSAVPWILIGTGAAVLTAGIVVGAMAQSDFEVWKKQTINSSAQADHASDDLEALQDRALIANIMMPAGALVIALGGTLLAMSWLDGDPPDERAQIGLAPFGEGVLLVARGRFEELQ